MGDLDASRWMFSWGIARRDDFVSGKCSQTLQDGVHYTDTSFPASVARTSDAPATATLGPAIGRPAALLANINSTVVSAAAPAATGSRSVDVGDSYIDQRSPATRPMATWSSIGRMRNDVLMR